MSKERKDKHFLHKPIYRGGSAAIKKLVSDNIQYPKEAKEAGITGTVHLRYDINHKGIVTGAKIISGLGYGCDEEAIRLVKLLKFQVAKNRGVRATFHKTIRIHFRNSNLQKDANPAPTTVESLQFSYSVTEKEKDLTGTEEAPAKTTYNYTINL